MHVVVYIYYEHKFIINIKQLSGTVYPQQYRRKICRMETGWDLKIWDR